MNILVVDDEALIAWNLAMELEGLGASVIGPCHSLEEGLATVLNVTPDLALLDINLHGEKVWPLADRLTEMECPIVFISADFNPAYIADKYPAACTLHKPIGPGDLEPLLRRIADGRQLASGTR